MSANWISIHGVNKRSRCVRLLKTRSLMDSRTKGSTSVSKLERDLRNAGIADREA